MRLYYVANARLPTEKAHGIQIAKMCEAFIEAGFDLTLVVPNRSTDRVSVREYYHLRVDVPLVRLPALDWYTGGRIGYGLSSLSFMCSYVFFLLGKRMASEDFVLYTVDIDDFSSSALVLLGSPLFSEMHGAKPCTFAQRMLFRQADGIIPINKIIAGELQESFPHSRARYLVEPNGVDLAMFAERDKRDARTRLGLPQDMPIVLYTGRFFEWKGLEIIPHAATLTPGIRWQTVGGEREHFAALVQEPLPANLFFAGSRPHREMPLWFAAADALLVLGTVRDIQSYRYTSPMKLFEYLAANRPIVASRTPAIQEIVSDGEVSFYAPDDEKDLARVAAYAATHTASLAPQTESAKRLAGTFSWSARAGRILRFIQESPSTHSYV